MSLGGEPTTILAQTLEKELRGISMPSARVEAAGYRIEIDLSDTDARGLLALAEAEWDRRQSKLEVSRR